jgi:ABC-type transport system involved in multi-copper enzyme maturation permease subunit
VKVLAAVFRLELRKTFFARRGLWVYLLAIAPFLLFAGYTVQNKIEAQQRQQLAARQQKPLTAADFAAIQRGTPAAAVIAQLGPPARQINFRRRRRAANDTIDVQLDARYRYSDGSTLYDILLENGAVRFVRPWPAPSLGDVNQLFATVFQFFYLRLVVFFGCLGIFMNLFRGELLDKSLHLYFLAPVRRERVMAGKFLAGLAAALVIFCGSTALQLWLLGRQPGVGALGHMAGYLGVTALACLGYGAVFLAAGLMFKNPIVPAAALLLWESVNPFLPALLKKISVIYYLTQLSPVSVTAVPGVSPLFSNLIAPPASLSPAAALMGLLVLAALILAYSARRARRLEIDYSAD